MTWVVRPAKGDVPLTAAARVPQCLVKVTVYKKSGCPWAAAVMGFLNELNVPYEVRNMTSHPQYAREAEEKSGKCKSPTVVIDNEVHADASVEDVAKALEKKGVVL